MRGIGKNQRNALWMLAMCEMAGTTTTPKQLRPGVGRSLEKRGLIKSGSTVTLTEAGRELLKEQAKAES